jgi:integrase/recombinase XerD
MIRASGITTYLKSGGTLEHAQQLAAHESARKPSSMFVHMIQVSIDEIELIEI